MTTCFLTENIHLVPYIFIQESFNWYVDQGTIVFMFATDIYFIRILATGVLNSMNYDCRIKEIFNLFGSFGLDG